MTAGAKNIAAGTGLKLIGLVKKFTKHGEI